MSAAKNIIAIHGAPRSGTSWLGQLFNSSPQVAYRYQPFFSYAFRGRIDTGSDVASLRGFFADLLATEDEFVLQSGTASMASTTPRFAKSEITHLAYKEVRFHHLLPHMMAILPELKAIGIVRDPRAVLASWAKAPREFDPTWKLADEWRCAERKNAGLEENWYGFARWKALAEMFLRLQELYPSRFRVVRYEELVDSAQDTLRLLFAFCDIPFSVQSQQFILDSSSHDDGETYGVFRLHGATGVGPALLDASIANTIVSELRNTTLSLFLSK